jgi:rapamycin-insensitive companion of mTOR
VLGLISSTAQGAEVLADYGWEATLSPLGLPTGISVPADLDKFTLVRPVSYHGADSGLNRDSDRFLATGVVREE